jgi:hypothetical protein
MKEESYPASIEAESNRDFGQSEERKRKTDEYIALLVRHYSETLVRQVLNALSHLPDFSPAEHLRRAGVFTAPLASLLSPFEYPQFELTFVHVDEQSIIVDIAEGLPEAGGGTRFYFQRRGEALTLTNTEPLWIS